MKSSSATKTSVMLAAFIALLSACGGSHYDAADETIATGTSNGNGSVNGPNDAFASQVSRVIEASEDSEEIDVATIALVTPETTEPIGLQ